MSSVDVSFVDQAVGRIGSEPEACIPILQALQGRYGYLPQPVLERVCELTRISPAQIEGVASFYMQFRRLPVGRHVIRVCVGTACHVKGSSAVHDELRKHLGLSGQQDTDQQGLFTLAKVACLGCCTLAPAVQIDDVTYGHVSPDGVGKILEDFLDLQRRRRRPRKPHRPVGRGHGEIRIGLGSCCLAKGSGQVQQALEAALAALASPARVKRVGCVGMCHQTPLVEVISGGGENGGRSFLYARVEPADARAIVLRHFRPLGLARRVASGVSGLLDRVLTDEAWQPVTRYAINVRDEPVHDFLDCQVHVATQHCGVLDPLDNQEYVAGGGFEALRRCVGQLSPQQVIDEIGRSGLRGRGGAGFPTARKWQAVRAADGMAKYVICNGDEGDPGAFMDRMILESYPYRVIEGMLIAAYAVGAEEAWFYIRAEYPLAVQRIRAALEKLSQTQKPPAGEPPKAGDDGQLPHCQFTCHLQHVLGTDVSLRVRIMEGAGAFVCGEETALIASIQGLRGMPRLRPPFPASSGLWGKPTLVNNVETLSVVPWIIRQGADAFAAMGTRHSKGTKVFALAGKVARGGLIEVPMGMTIGQIVGQIGGGIAGAKAFKAVQIGGPSGGCLPASLAGTPVDYEALTAQGAIMGSGGLVVLDETDCMVEIARYFLEFTQDQSCGKCTFCRLGTRRMLDILERLCDGQGRKGDLEALEHLGGLVQRGSLCGLGRTAPNPVLSTLKHFRSEYEAHLAGKCPAGKCRKLIRYFITDDCIGCTRCAQHCPAGAIEFRPYEKHEIDQAKCVRCNTCRAVCPSEAVKVE